MDNVKFIIIRNWLMSEYGNDYWTYIKYAEKANIKPKHNYCNMEVFLDSPFDENGKDIKDNELIWKMRASRTFNIHDMFMWYENGKLHSANKVFPNLCEVNEVAKFIIDNNDDLEDDELHEILKSI